MRVCGSKRSLISEREACNHQGRTPGTSGTYLDAPQSEGWCSLSSVDSPNGDGAKRHDTRDGTHILRRHSNMTTPETKYPFALVIRCVYL